MKLFQACPRQLGRQEWSLPRRVLGGILLVALVVGTVVGALVFVTALGAALYAVLASGSVQYIVWFFLAGAPMFSGVSAVLLGLTARVQARRGTSLGTVLMALYAAAYSGLVSFLVYAALERGCR